MVIDMSGLFSTPKPPPVSVTATTPPMMTDPSIQQAGALAQFAAAAARGRASTIATGGTGLTAAAPVARRTILGG